MAGYHNVTMGFFVESWKGRAGARALLRGGKAECVELSEYGHESWMSKRSLEDRLQGAWRLPRLLAAAECWLSKQGKLAGATYGH